MLQLAHLCMSNKGKLIALKVGTLNCRGLRNTGKRRAIYRQVKEYCDLLHTQDTHLDVALSKQVGEAPRPGPLGPGGEAFNLFNNQRPDV